MPWYVLRRSFFVPLLALLTLNVLPLGADVVRYVTGGASPGPVASADDRLYLVSEDRYLYAFDLQGTRLWREDIQRLPVGPPVVGPDGTIFVSRQGRGITAYNRRGSRLWSADLPDILGAPVVSPRGVLVVPRDAGWTSVYSPSGRLLNSFRTAANDPDLLALSSLGYLVSVGEGGRVTARDGAGNEAWEAHFGEVPTSMAIGTEGGVVLGLSDGRVVFVDDSGDPVRVLRAPGAIRRLRLGNGLVAAVLANGALWVFDEELNRSWEADPPRQRFNGVALSSSSVVATASQGSLYRFTRKGALLQEVQLPERVSLSEPVFTEGEGIVAIGNNWTAYLFPAVGPAAGESCAMPWGCPRGGPRLTGSLVTSEARDLVLPRGTTGGNLERIYFEELLSSDDAEERETGLSQVSERLAAGRLGAVRIYIVPLLRAIAARSRGVGRTAEERVRAMKLLAAVGTYEAAASLSGLAGTLEDTDLLGTLAEVLGTLRTDPDGRLAAALRRILQRSDDPATAASVVEAAKQLVDYAGAVYAPEMQALITDVAEGSYPLRIKRRALELGSFD